MSDTTTPKDPPDTFSEDTLDAWEGLVIEAVAAILVLTGLSATIVGLIVAIWTEVVWMGIAAGTAWAVILLGAMLWMD